MVENYDLILNMDSFPKFIRSLYFVRDTNRVFTKSHVLTTYDLTYSDKYYVIIRIYFYY